MPEGMNMLFPSPLPWIKDIPDRYTQEMYRTHRS